MEWDGEKKTILDKVWSKCNQVHMKIWNLKFDSSMYSNFEVKYRALPNVIFGKSIYYFKA